MVAIFVGSGAGLARGSGSLLGGAGVLGSAVQGRAAEAVSINAANGNLLIAQQDEFLAGRGLDIGISRTYNSLAQMADGDNGDNWQMGTVRRVVNFTGTLNTAGSTVQRLGGDGSLITYSYATRDGVAAYWTTDGDGAHDKLVKSGTTWIWTDGTTQVTETYAEHPAGSGSWRITKQTDIDNYSLTFSYVGTSDLLDKVTTANGEWVQYLWSGTNITQIVTGYTDLATSTAKTLTRTWYDYTAGRLTQVRVDLTPDDNVSPTAAQSYWTQYAYDASGRLTQIKQKDGSQVDITYDGSGRVATLTQQVASGDTRVTSLSYGAGFTSVTGPDGQMTRLDYDAAQRLTKITAPPAHTGAAAQIIQFAWDADGNVASVTDAAGKITSYTYDADGNVTKITDPNLNTVERWYDAKNRMTRQESFGVSAASANIAQNSRYAYDGEGHLRYVVDAEGLVTEYRYTATGLLQYAIRYPEHPYGVGTTLIDEATMDAWRNALTDRSSTQITVYSYDARGNQTAALYYGFATVAGDVSTAEGYSRVYTTYDQAGRMLTRYNQGETSETFVYDGLGRLTASTNTMAGTTTIVFDDVALKTTITTAAGFRSVNTYNKAGDLVSAAHSGSYDVAGTTTYAYDKNGRVRVATDATGYKSFFLYDKAGRKTAEINAFGHMVEYRYDANNRVIATTHYHTAISAANLTALDNPNNTLEIAAIRPTAHASDIWSWTVYDAAGRVVQAIDGTGGVAAFEYDKSNRLVKTTAYFNKVAVASLKTTPPLAAVAVTAHAKDTVSRTFYNRNGQLIGALDGEGYLSEIVYDKAGQKVEEIAYSTKTGSAHWAAGTFDQLRATAAPTAATNRRVRHVYDGQGKLRYTVDSAGGVTGFTYNVAGKLTKTTVFAAAISTSDFTYDNVKALVVANAANDRATTIAYNGQGLVASTVDATGLSTAFTYDSSGRVIKSVAGSGGTARTSYNYYTASGDLRFTVDPEGFVRRYDYDAAGRKTREVVWDTPIGVTDATTIAQVNSLAAGTWADVRYEYDAAGRVSSTYDGVGNRTHYSYYATGKLAGIYYAYGTADQSLTHHGYDGAGRLVSESFAHGEPEQAVVSYAYDGLGNRTSVTDARGAVTTYTYDETGRILTATDAAGGVTAYAYNAFGDVTQTTDARSAVTTNIYNSLGQLTRTTDALGLHTDYSYTAFGELASVTRAGATTSFQYDKLGRVTRATDALGHYEAYTYNAFGNRITARNKLGGTTTYAYDRRGLLTSETLPIGSYNSAGTLVASTVTNSYAYDARGNRTQMVEAAGLAEARTTSFVYDKANRLTRTIGQTFHGLTPNSYIYYDARGNVTSTVDPAGGRTVNYYDDLGRVKASISPVGTYTVNTYDKNGNITAVRVYATPVAVPAGGGAKEAAPATPAGAWRETTFTYDSLNRLTGSSMAGIKSGTFNGTSWVADTSAITTAYDYDAVGNVVKATDANGNVTWSYYDVLGRKTAQIDGEGYRTDWTYNADGNVASERRYWNKAAAPSGTTTPPAVTAHATLDRITNFTYDLNGNRLSEARTGVQVHNGSGGYSSVTATVSYLYNGLGQVTRKTEATGDQVNYTYDSGGRLTVEARQSFVDQSGASVTPTVDYYYDGVGNLSRTRQRGNANAAERVTTYGYDGGKLRWMRDAEAQDANVTDGLLTYYWYDSAGRLTHEYYARYDSAGALTKNSAGAAADYEGVLTAYDAAGRVTQKWQSAYNSSGWTDLGPRAVTAYNAFGEVVSVAIGGVTQQQNQYDAAGRLVATNGGDGVWKHFGYDKNGNQTIAITSAGASLSGNTFDQAFAMIAQSDVNPTFTRYDKRNMALNVTETGRQLAVGGAAQTLTTTRAYNAFGEVASETNALNATIDYTYNNMGRLIKSESPTVSITLENGTTSNVRPTEQYYYDASGRLVATRDANNNLTRLTLLAGSGYGGSEALVTVQTAADGGVRQTKYDIHGDARELVGELGHRTLQTFDKKGRMTIRQELRNAANANDDFYAYYAYDGLGQQLKHWNNAFQTPVYGDPVWIEDPYYPPYPPYYEYPVFPPEGGGGGGYWHTPIVGYTPDVETNDYDFQGRVTRHRAFGGDVTTTAYTWEAGMATSGLGTFGGWSQTTTMANGLYSIEKADLFGRATYKRNLGGHITSYSYDVAGRLSSSALGGLTTTFTWLNSGFLGRMATGTPNAGSQTSSWTRDTATYGYDKVGNRLTEQLVKEAGIYTPGYIYYHNPYEPDWMPESYYETSELVKNATATYDALGRLKTWTEAGTAKSPAASISNEYDAAGNVRRTLSTYRTLNSAGVAATTASTRDYWFRYDSMNRVVVNQGALSSGVITRGVTTYGLAGAGQDIAYNVAGQRTSVATTNAYFDGYGGYTANEVKELYYYDDGGRLIETREATGAAVSGGYGGGDPAVPAATGTGVRRSSYSYDLIGRQTLQQDYQTNGTTVVFSRSASYNEKGQLASDYTSNLKTDNKTYTSSTTYNYGAGSGYMLGAVVSQSSSNGVTGQSTIWSSTTNNYIWHDGALQSSISHKPNTSQSTTYTTTFSYNGMGQLTSAWIADGKPHSVTFTNDELGQIIRRDESNISGQTGAPQKVLRLGWPPISLPAASRFQIGRATRRAFRSRKGHSDWSKVRSIARPETPLTKPTPRSARSKGLSVSRWTCMKSIR